MTPDDKVLRSKLIRLAASKPDLQPHLLPLLKEATEDKVAGSNLSMWYGFAQEGIKKAITALERADSTNGTTISPQSAQAVSRAVSDIVDSYNELSTQTHVLVSAIIRNTRLDEKATPADVEKVKSWLQTLVDPHFRG